MIRILMIVPNPEDATSFYRANGAFSELLKTEQVSLIYADKFCWSTAANADFAFMQRPYDASHLQIAEICRNIEMPLWIDYDDMLLDVPSDNPAFPTYSLLSTKENIIKITKLATVVTVSTNQLKRCLQLEKNPLNERIYVVPNALNDKLVKKAQPHKHSNRFCWRGTNTHMRDVFGVQPEIVQFAQRYPMSLFNWVGWNPWGVTDCMKAKQAIIAPTMGIHDYFSFITKINPAFQIVPLDNSMFNRCKSNIAWIESNLAGAVCIAPDWEEWRMPGVFNYKTAEQFYEQMEYVWNNPEETAKAHAAGWEYIRTNLLLSKINEKRMAIAQTMKSIAMGYAPVWPDGWEKLPPASPPMLDESEVMTLQ